MLQRKKSGRGVQGILDGVYSAGVVCVTILLVGALASIAVIRGWIQTDQLRYVSLGAVFLGAVLGGVTLCVRTKGIPILCGVAVGGTEVLICLVVGVFVSGAPTLVGGAVFALTGLAGGILGGILCTMMRRPRHR